MKTSKVLDSGNTSPKGTAAFGSRIRAGWWDRGAGFFGRPGGAGLGAVRRFISRTNVLSLLVEVRGHDPNADAIFPIHACQEAR